MTDVEHPYTKRPLSQALLEAKTDVTHFFGNLPAEMLFEAPTTGWSPAGHLRHLVKSVTPVTLGMKLPRPVLALLFGRSSRVSRRFNDIRNLYRVKLSEGLSAPLLYRPIMRPVKGDLTEHREVLLRKWEKTATALLKVLNRWQEADLDRYRLPHPSLGKLSVREMLLFTLYHNMHHIQSVQSKLDIQVEKAEQT